MKSIFDRFDFNLAEFIIITLIVMITISLIWVAMKPSPPYYSLVKTEWVCLETKTEKKVRLQAAGKATIPISRTEEVCISYKRNY